MIFHKYRKHGDHNEKNNHNEPLVKDITTEMRRYREPRASMLRVKKNLFDNVNITIPQLSVFNN